jgi:hypothetical protein
MFTNDEETAVGLSEVVPFLLQTRLEELGAIGARAAAICVLNTFIEHARGLDGCAVPQRRKASRVPAA